MERRRTTEARVGLTRTLAADELAHPIFILGIMQRSGTNFLHDLLAIHPDLGSPAPIWEDSVLRDAHLLLTYAHAARERWNPDWGLGLADEERLCERLGDGVIAFLQSHSNGKRLLTKTPSVDNLGDFFKLFPHAHLIITIRDGRAVVESAVRSFGWTYEWAMQRWAASARAIIDFDQTTRSVRIRYHIVKYEDLCTALKPQLQRLLPLLDLDTDRYDFDAAERLPVRGSSSLRQAGARVHWEPVAKDFDFDPIERWKHWTRPLHERFNWIAGEPMRALGYTLQSHGSHRSLWAAWNRALDLKWRMRQRLKALARRPG